MPLKITDPQRDLPRLNRELARLKKDVEIARGVSKKLDLLEKKQETLANQRELVSTNNVTLVWVGPSLKVTWVAGYVKDKAGVIHQIPAGERTSLTANTYYWFGWNPKHQTMSVASNPETLTAIKNILIICRLFTGTAVQTANAGGGGTEIDTTRGGSGKEYKLL